MDIRIQDIKISDVYAEDYDLALFACGYEKRCTFLLGNLDIVKIKEARVLKHLNNKTEDGFYENEQFFLDLFPDNVVEVSANDLQLYQILHSCQFEKDSVRILVDYSSMSKMWYNAMFNWFKFEERVSSCIIDFVYTKGIYRNEFNPLLIHDILALPGCEGSFYNKDKTIALFGLGFDATVALTVFDRFEPDIVGTYYASPGSSVGDSIKVKEKNSQFLKSHADFTLKFPISNISAIVGELKELLTDNLGKDNIIIVPLGPKPHVLASIILSHRYNQHITCLRVSGSRRENVDVSPKIDENGCGDFVTTRVEMRKKNE